MKIKAIYTKTIEVEADISKEEFDNIESDGLPVNFDYMADEIDNVQPLEFDHYILLESDNESNELKKCKKLTKQQIQLISVLLVGLIISIAGSIINIVIYQDTEIILVDLCIFWTFYVPIICLLFWMDKVTKYIKIHDPNWKY